MRLPVGVLAALLVPYIQEIDRYSQVRPLLPERTVWLLPNQLQGILGQ